jgi:hypothetical protein
MISSSVHSAVSVSSSLLTLAQTVNPRISADFQAHQAALKRFLRNPKGFSFDDKLMASLTRRNLVTEQEARSSLQRLFANNSGYVLAHIEGILAIATSEAFDETYLSLMTPSQQSKVCIILNQLRLARQSLADYIWDLTPAQSAER